MNADEIIFANNFIADEIDRLYDWSIGDIRKCAGLKEDGTFIKKRPYVGAFILWCCAIDFWGGILTNSSSSVCRFESFTDSYLVASGNYDFRTLYNLRNKLVHNYTPKVATLETDECKEKLHLKKQDGRVLLHLRPCILHLEKAVQELISDLKEKDERKIIAWRYFNKHPPIKPV